LGTLYLNSALFDLAPRSAPPQSSDATNAQTGTKSISGLDSASSNAQDGNSVRAVCAVRIIRRKNRRVDRNYRAGCSCPGRGAISSTVARANLPRQVAERGPYASAGPGTILQRGFRSRPDCRPSRSTPASRPRAKIDCAMHLCICVRVGQICHGVRKAN